jgi:hypothetical protein
MQHMVFQFLDDATLFALVHVCKTLEQAAQSAPITRKRILNMTENQEWDPFLETGSLSLVKWAETIGFDDTLYKQSLRCAAKSGSIPLVEYIVELGLRDNEIIILTAARFGHLELVKWYVEHIPTFPKSTFAHAADGGHSDILEWLHANEYKEDIL